MRAHGLPQPLHRLILRVERDQRRAAALGFVEALTRKRRLSEGDLRRTVGRRERGADVRLLVGEPRPASSGRDLRLRTAQERERRGAFHQRLEPPPGLTGLAGIVARHCGQQLCVEPLPVGRRAALRAAFRSHCIHERQRPAYVLLLEQREEQADARAAQRGVGREHLVVRSCRVLGAPKREQGVRLRVPDVRRDSVAVLSERGDGLDRRGPPPAIAQADHAVAPQAQQES